MSGLKKIDSSLANLQILNSFNISDDNTGSSLASDSSVNQKSGIKKETLDDNLFKEAIVSTRRLDDMVILNGDIDNLLARFVYMSIELESKASRAYNSTIFQSYTKKIDYSTLERKLSLLNKQSKKQDMNQTRKVELPGVIQSIIESKIIESFTKNTTVAPANNVNSTVRVKRQIGETFERSKTTEKRNIKPRRKFSETLKGQGIPRKRKIGRTDETYSQLPKILSYAIKKNELTTDENNILVVNSDQLLPSFQNIELGITKASLVVKKNFKSMCTIVSLTENLSSVKQMLPTVEIEERCGSEPKTYPSNVYITQQDQGQPLQVTTREAKTKKSFSETNISLTNENKDLSPRPENIDVLLQLNQSTEFSALVKQKTHDATEKPKTDNLLFASDSSDFISQPGTEVSFVLHQDQCPTSAACMASTNQEKNDTESDQFLITSEISGPFQKPEFEQIQFEKSSDKSFVTTELDTMIKPEINDTTSETVDFLVHCYPSVRPTTEEISSESSKDQSSIDTETIDIPSDSDQLLVASECIVIPETDDILLKSREQTSTSTEITALINSETTDTISETDRLLVSGESTDLFLGPENFKIATEASEMDPLLIMTEVTDLTLSPENVEISLESEQEQVTEVTNLTLSPENVEISLESEQEQMTEVTNLTLSPENVEFSLESEQEQDQDLTAAEIITALKSETKHFQANKTTNANVFVRRNKKKRLSKTNSVAKSKTSSGLKYTKLTTDIRNKLSSNVKKLKMHIVKKPVDLFEILPLSFFRKNMETIKKCKPLTITLIDYKVYAKMSKLHEHEVSTDILRLTNYIQQKPNLEDYIKKENTKTNVNKPKSLSEQIARSEYRRAKWTNKIEILDLASKIIEIYELDGRYNIVNFEKNKLVDDFDIEDFKAGIDLKEPTKAIVCCWFKRRALVKLLCTKFGQHTSFTFIKNRHTCPFGKCKCCVQCQNENRENLSLPNMEKHDQTVKSLRKITTLSVPSEPKILIDKALAYAQNLSFRKRLSGISDNIVSSAQKQIQALSKPWLNNEIIEVCNLSSGIVEVYDVDSKGELQTLIKERNISEQSNLLLLGDIIDVSKKSSIYKTCCWNKREQIIEKLRNLKVKPETLSFIRKKHTCPIDNCDCCCPYVQVINLKVVNNEPINEGKKRKSTFPIANQLEKHIQTNPMPNISNQDENNTNILENKDDILMQSIIDEEISNLIKDSNSPLSTFYEVDRRDQASHAFPKPKSGFVQPSEKKGPVIEIGDDDENTSIANVLSNDTTNIPRPPPLVQSQQPPIVEVNTIITQILNRFQGLRLNIDERGQVQAVLQNTLDNVSTLELSLLKQILAHAQSLVDKYKITSNANLSNMMGIPEKQPQLYNEQAASRVAQSGTHNIPVASTSTKVPLVQVQSNRHELTRPTLTQTPVIKNVYSCRTNAIFQQNHVSQDGHFYRPNPISRPIPITKDGGSQQPNTKPNPVHGDQSSQSDSRPRTANKPTISVTSVLASNQPQTTSKPATTLLSNLLTLPKTTESRPHSSDGRCAIPRIAPRPITKCNSELSNLTLANMLNSNTYKRPNFQSNNVNPQHHRISAPVYDVSMATCSVGTTTKDLGNKTTKKSKKEGLQKSYEMLSRIQPVVLSHPPPLRPFSNENVAGTDRFKINNASNNNPSDSGISLLPEMPYGNNSATLTHVISNTGAANLNPLPVLCNVVSLKQNPIANVSVREPKTHLEHNPSRPNVEASCLYPNETTRSLNQDSSSTDSAPESLKTEGESSFVTVWCRKPEESTLFEDLQDQNQASSSKHKLADENETQHKKKRKLSQDTPLDFPMPKIEIKEEGEDDIIFL